MSQMRIHGLIAGLLVGGSLTIHQVNAQFSANYQTNTISGVSSNWPGGYYVGSNTFGNGLVIQDGGVLSDTTGYVAGTLASSSNSVLVSGSGSLWSNAIDLYVGFQGSNNSLVISNSGQVVDVTSAAVGYSGSSSGNRVQVTGPGSVWKSHYLNFGRGGATNSLVVSNGGRAEVETTASIGMNYSSSGNELLVTGAGSIFQNIGTFFDLGYSGGANKLTISKGGRVNCNYADVGVMASSSNNLVWVTDSGSLWDVSADATELTIGYNARGNRLVVTNGGRVDAYYACAGLRNGGNSILVTDPGSVFYVTCYIYSGKQGSNNTFTAANGSYIRDKFCYINYEAGSSNNSVLLTGTNTYWYHDYNMMVGMSGRGGTLVISNGARMFDREDGILGFDPTSKNNRATVTGPGSRWGSRWDMIVGYGSMGNSLVINDGATITNRNGVVGNEYGSDSNTAVVTGSGSLWNNQSNLFIGLEGIGNNLVISNGGRLAADTSYLGRNPESRSNKVTVAGSGSGWTNQSQLLVGCLGTFNTLTVTNGGWVAGDWGFIGYGTNSTGNQAIIAGADSVWTNGTVLFVGYKGSSNTLVIREGGLVVNQWGFLGDEESSHDNTVCVESSGVWRNDNLVVGNEGSRNYLYVDGGSVFANRLDVGYDSLFCDNLVRVDNGLVMVTNATQDAVLEVYNGGLVIFGGTVRADKIIATNECAQFFHTGGTLIYRTLDLHPDYDVDADHIPNGWEQAYGLNPLDLFDGDTDKDGDGMSNRDEYLAGTNPTNTASCLRISSLLVTNGNVRVNWTAVRGKTYALQTNSAYCTNFTDCGLMLNIPGSGEVVTNFLDLGGATTPVRNYRLRLVP